MGKIAQIQQTSIGRPVYRMGHWVSRAGLLFLLFLAGCGGGGSTPFAPQVVKTDPGNEAGNVPVDAPIRATFSYDMDPVTVNKETFIVSGVPGTVSYQDRTAIFTPSGAGLERGKQYNAILTTGVKDLDGISLPSNFIWSFITEGEAVFAVESTVPNEGVENVSINAVIEVIFSKPVNPATVQNPKNFFIQGAEAESIRYQEADKKAILKPKGGLAFGRQYVVTVTKGVQAADGAFLAANYIWSFKTGSEPDLIRPTIRPDGRNPGKDATNVPVGADISVRFSETVNEGVQSAVTVREEKTGEFVSGQVGHNSDTVTFNPEGDLRFNAQYRVTVRAAGVKDLSENVMSSDDTWTFTTEPVPDKIPPGVADHGPRIVNGPVSVKSRVAARFNEPMNLQSVENADSFLVHDNGRVSGVVRYDTETWQAVFTSTERLKYNTTYSVFLTGKMRDLAGNALPDFFWQFTTTSPPEVFEQWPAPNEQNVAVEREIAARFSRPMADGTINLDSFQVVQQGPAGGRIGGTVRYDGLNHVAIFTPNPPLQSGAVYQVTLSTAIEDQGQNPLDSPAVWSFSTASPDATPPQVVATQPAHGAGGFPATDPFGNATWLQATFSEAVRSESVHPGSFVVEKIEADFSRRGISGTIQPQSGDPATFFFAPNPPLDRGANYEARLTTGITDLAGNPLPSDYLWSFTTAP